MADEKLNTGSGEEKLPEAPAPVAADAASLRAVLSGSRSISSNMPQDTSSGTSRNCGRLLRLDKRMFLLLSRTCLLYTSRCV